MWPHVKSLHAPAVRSDNTHIHSTQPTRLLVLRERRVKAVGSLTRDSGVGISIWGKSVTAHCGVQCRPGVSASRLHRAIDTYGRPVCDAGTRRTFRTCFAHVSRCFTRFTQGISHYARFAHVSRMFRDVSRCFARFADDSRIRDVSHMLRARFARFAHRALRTFRACFAHVSQV